MPGASDLYCPEDSWVILSVAWFIGFAVGGIYYLTISNTYDGEYLGTLVAGVTSYTGDSDSEGGKNWYIVEKFRKDNTSDTCSVTRLQVYYTIRALNNAKDHVILGTTRKIWARWNHKHTCYDTSVKHYETTLGISLLAVAIGVPVLLHLASLIKRDRIRPRFALFHRRYRTPRAMDPERDFSNSLSSGSAIYRNVVNHHPFEGTEQEEVDELKDDSSTRTV
jgi:hypothetical protein